MEKIAASTLLRVNEVFYSIQGESVKVGLPTIFIRLTGCPLRCQYCDTAYAFYEGKKFTIDEILEVVRGYGAPHVTVTGGEPLAQKSCLVLLARLCDEGYHVSLETSGAMILSKVDNRVMKIVDIKTPGSAEVDKNKLEIFLSLSPQDQIKFVLCDRVDYDWAKNKLDSYQLVERCEVLFSPAYGQLALSTLADWILQDRLSVRLQTQLHKHIWGDVAGR